MVYAPGTLTVVAYKNGKQWATDKVETTGEPYAVQLTADRAVLSADGQDLTFITATLVDTQGRCVPTANNRLSFSVEGQGMVVATDNGDPTDMNSLASVSRRAFNGFCLAIVKGQKGGKTALFVTASADGLKPGVVAVNKESSSSKTR